MQIFRSKADRVHLLGFNDLPVMILGMLPLAWLANVLFGGANPGMDVTESATCYGVAFLFTLVHWLISRQVVMQLRESFPREQQTAVRLGLTFLILALSVLLVSTGTQPFVRWFMQDSGIPQPSVFFKFVMTYTLVIMVVAAYEGGYFFTKYKQSLLEREQLAKENMRTQLAVLKHQMNPHFLFNSLNTLVNVIPEDPATATLFTQRLAAVYRRILEYRHKELIGLEEELLALQDYIFLMQTRFEEKLVIEWRLSDRAVASMVARTQVLPPGPPKGGEKTEELCSIPKEAPQIPLHLHHHRIVPLSVQLLVENAIKHNVVSSAHPLRITITLDDEQVIVSNPLQLRDRTLSSTGWGHQNLRARYAALTGREMVIEQTATDYTVYLPILPGAAATERAELAATALTRPLGKTGTP